MSSVAKEDITPLVLTLKELESVMGITLLPPANGGSLESVDEMKHHDYWRPESSTPIYSDTLDVMGGSSAGDKTLTIGGSISRLATDTSSTGGMMGGASGGSSMVFSRSGSGTVGIGAGTTVTEAGSIMEFVNMDDLNSGRENRTTFMVRRLPRYLSVDQLEMLIESTGLLDDSYDLLYVPIFTGKAHANRGYAFINFKSPKLGAMFVSIVKYSVDTPLSKQLSKCDIVYAHIQGRDEMVSNLTRVRSVDSSPSAVSSAPTVAAQFINTHLPPGLKLF